MSLRIGAEVGEKLCGLFAACLDVRFLCGLASREIISDYRFQVCSVVLSQLREARIHFRNEAINGFYVPNNCLKLQRSLLLNRPLHVVCPPNDETSYWVMY